MADDAASSADNDDSGGLSETDVEKLADKVYRLMLDEIRLGRVRGELPAARAGRGRS